MVSLSLFALEQGPLLYEQCSYSYSLEQKPKTQCYFEGPHRRIKPPQVHYLGEVGENDEDESTHRAKYRRDHTPPSQRSRDVVRFEPQVAANRGCQCIKQQANVIHVKASAQV